MAVDGASSTADTAAEDAKALTALRAKRATAEAQKATYAESKGMLEALNSHVQELDQQIAALVQKRHQELQPHQVGLLLSQRQHELNTALRKTAEVEKAADEKLSASVSKQKVIADGFDKEIEALVAAKEAARRTMMAEYDALVAQRLNSLASNTRWPPQAVECAQCNRPRM